MRRQRPEPKMISSLSCDHALEAAVFKSAFVITGFAEETFPHSSSWIPDAGLTLRSTAAGNNHQSIGETTDVNT